MKICLICSHGGHLTQMLHLMEAFEGHETFFVTYRSERTRNLARRYLLDYIGTNPLKMAKAALATLIILLKERPTLIVSTGSEIAIPAFYLARLMGIKSIFIETWTRILGPSGTGRLVYPVSNVFLVQWPALLARYGKKARYEGAVI
ncbi:MAG: capsular biosynthesis protein [Dehalococcoidia bacterium]|nr:capsular biosynthesis protein [Dehalococcoidia bacterium]